MKIRSGFVSNSSTSSFCIYGAKLERSIIEEFIKRINFNKDERDQYELYKEIETLANKEGLSFYKMPYNEVCYVGMPWSSIGGDETGNQLRERARKAIISLVDKELVCETHEEAYAS